MFKALVIAVATTCLLTSSPLLAQSFDLGPGGPRIDLRGPGEREREREREFRHEQEMRASREERRREERRREGRFERDGERCRTVEIRERDDYGDWVVRRRRECRD